MELPENGCLLRIFTGESDHLEGKPFYQAVVEKARELNLAGATVLRGVMGYGASSRIHTASILALSDDLPIVVEIVDIREKIEQIMPFLEEHLKGGLVTIEKATVIKYKAGEK